MIPDLISALIPNLIAAAIWSALTTTVQAFRKWLRARRTTVNVIHKVPLNLDQPTTIDALKVLHVGEQRGVLTAWVLRSDHEQDLRYTLTVQGTGQAFPENYRYVGTVQVSPFVWHVLQCSEPILAPPR